MVSLLLHTRKFSTCVLGLEAEYATLVENRHLVLQTVRWPGAVMRKVHSLYSLRFRASLAGKLLTNKLDETDK